VKEKAMNAAKVVGIVCVAGAALAACGPGAGGGGGAANAPATDRAASNERVPHESPAAPADSIYFGSREIPPRTPGTVRIATYNLLNLFDDIDDPAYSGDVEDIDDAKPESEREALAAAIRRLDADVLALQEIESESALREFRDEHLGALGYEHLVSVDTGDPRGIECAVLSRFPIQNVEHWAGLELGGVHPDLWGSGANWNAGRPITFKRSPLRVDVAVRDGAGETTEPYMLTLFVLHNKSGAPGGYWREAESRKIAELVDAARTADPDAKIVVLGDMNARDDEPSVRLLLDAGLTRVAPFDPSRQDATASHESGRRIDHILVSDAALRELVDGSGFVMGMPSRAPGADWRAVPPPEGFASDHFPVAVELWIGDR
jgi:endonuclease/exonuclease/phosphatase family metal-dependent hydrolase